MFTHSILSPHILFEIIFILEEFRFARAKRDRGAVMKSLEFY